MRKKNNKRKFELPISNNIFGILIANGVGAVLVFILIFLASLLLIESSSLLKLSSVYFIGIVILCAFVTGFVASKKCKFKGLVSGIIASLPFAFIIMIFMLIFSNGQINNTAWILFGGIILFSAVGGIFSANLKRIK